MVRFHTHTSDLVPPIDALEDYLHKGGVTILQAAFEHSFFTHPASVRSKTPYFPDRARYSRKVYPGKGKGDRATWKGREVILDDNAYAQQAWQRYSGRIIYRGSGYSVRHIWGNPWDPDAFTAGWNLCYMPFWAGMLTEKQHPHPELQRAVQQASWDLFFRNDPVCAPPDFVEDPGMNLDSVLGDQTLRVLVPDDSPDPGDTPQPPGHLPRGKPLAFQLWGQLYPVRYGTEILLGVAKCIHRAHRDSFADRILTLSWASLDGGNRWKEVESTGIFLNVNFKVDELIRRSYVLIELFSHPSSDLEVAYY